MPKRYAPWLAKATSVVVLLDALTSTAKRLNLDSFIFLSNLTVEGGEIDSCCEKKRLGAYNLKAFENLWEAGFVSGRNLPVFAQDYVIFTSFISLIFRKPVVDAERHVDYIPTLFAHTRKTAVVDNRKNDSKKKATGRGSSRGFRYCKVG